MRVPVSVPLGGKRIKIEYRDVLPGDPEDGGDLSGETCAADRLIRISKTANKSEDAVFTTLFHEMLHMALAMTGHSEGMDARQEEAMVYALENMLADLFHFRANAKVRWREIEFPWEDG